MVDSCTDFNLLVILSCSFHSLPPEVVLWVATQLFCAGPNLNLKVNSAPVHKSLNLISGLTFKFKVVPYPSVTCCVTHSNDVFMWSSHPLETRDLTKQTNWKMCVTLHLLKTFEPFELLVALSFLAIQAIFVINRQRQGVISPTCGRGLTASKLSSKLSSSDFVL